MEKILKDAKVAIYTKSNDQSTRNQFIQDKMEVLQDYAKRKGFDNIDKFYIDTKNGEKELKCMLSDIRANKINVVIVGAAKELGRDVIELMNYIKNFEKNNVRYIFFVENMDSNEESMIKRYYKNLFNFIKKEEKKYIAERNRKIRENKKKYAIKS